MVGLVVASHIANGLHPETHTWRDGSRGQPETGPRAKSKLPVQQQEIARAAGFPLEML